MKRNRHPKAPSHAAPPHTHPEDRAVAAMVNAFYDAARAHRANGLAMLRAALTVVLSVTYDTGGDDTQLCALVREQWGPFAARERAAEAAAGSSATTTAVGPTTNSALAAERLVEDSSGSGRDE